MLFSEDKFYLFIEKIHGRCESQNKIKNSNNLTENTFKRLAVVCSCTVAASKCV